MENIRDIMLAKLPQRVAALLGDIGGEAAHLGYKLYLVGGVVRDLMLGTPSLDLDLVVEGDAPALARHLAKKWGIKATTHQRFGTAKLLLEDMSIDLATARTEAYSRPGALPEVKPGSMDDDLRRRDFTINAIAVDLTPSGFGRVLDPHGGAADIEKRMIRVLHEGSFADDATRMLRALRYEQRFDFALEERTELLLRENTAMLDAVSGDRIRNELELIFNEERPEKALRRADETGVLHRISPALKCDSGTVALFEEARASGRGEPSVYMALLARDLGYEEIDDLAARLNLGSEWKGVILATARLRKQLHMLEDPSLKPGDVYRMLQPYPRQSLDALYIASASATARSHIDKYENELMNVATSLGGDDLINMGAKQGPDIGRILNSLLDARLNGEISTEEEERRYALKMIEGRRVEKPGGDDSGMEEYCDICGNALDNENVSNCGFCGRRFHMTWNTDQPVENCGQVWFDPRSTAMGFACEECLEANPWMREAVVDLEQPPDRQPD